MHTQCVPLSPGYKATTKDSAPDHNSALTLVGVSKRHKFMQGEEESLGGFDYVQSLITLKRSWSLGTRLGEW